MTSVRPYPVVDGGRRSSRRIRSGDVGQEAMEVDDEHITPARKETGIKLRAARALGKNLVMTAPASAHCCPPPPAPHASLTHAGACGMPTDLLTAVLIAIFATQQHFCQLLPNRARIRAHARERPGPSMPLWAVVRWISGGCVHSLNTYQPPFDPA